MFSLKFKLKKRIYLAHGCRGAARRLFPSSHDADHLLPGRLSHEPLIDDLGHAVVADSQRSEAPDPDRHTLCRLGLVHAGKTPGDPRAPEGATGVS